MSENPIPHLPDIVMIIIVILAILRIAFDKHLNRCLIGKRVFILLGFLFGMRCICVMSTNLPNPYANCVHYEYTRNVFLEAFLVVFTGKTTCTDVFFR